VIGDWRLEKRWTETGRKVRLGALLDGRRWLTIRPYPLPPTVRKYAI